MKKLTVVVLAMIVIFSISGLVFESNELQYTETTEVYVRQGDTLWNIASSVNRCRYNNHQVILEIKRLNKLDGVKIIPGQVLEIPQLE